MKAALYSFYGSPDVVKIEDVAKPVPKDNEVLIKVCASSVNPLERGWIKGTPYIVRLAGGLRKPKDRRLGVDVAGWIEAIGKSVTRFKSGDEVFGMCRGSFAEYVCASESSAMLAALSAKPANVTFEQAAAVPVAGLTALQGLRDKAQIQPGQKVLINGAAGGVGTFAVQMAKSYGADVTGVRSTRNASMVRSLGADRVIDYTQEDFTKSGLRYDVLFDCVGNHPLFACRHVLTPAGKCIVIGCRNGGWLSPVGRLLKALVMSWFGGQTVPFLAKATAEDLLVLRELIEAGRLVPVSTEAIG